MQGGKPVSYTHLDVYKRQVVGYEYNKSGDVKTNTFTIVPYARYFFLSSNVVRLFADGEMCIRDRCLSVQWLRGQWSEVNHGCG